MYCRTNEEKIKSLESVLSSFIKSEKTLTWLLFEAEIKQKFYNKTYTIFNLYYIYIYTYFLLYSSFKKIYIPSNCKYPSNLYNYFNILQIISFICVFFFVIYWWKWYNKQFLNSNKWILNKHWQSDCNLTNKYIQTIKYKLLSSLCMYIYVCACMCVLSSLRKVGRWMSGIHYFYAIIFYVYNGSSG